MEKASRQENKVMPENILRGAWLISLLSYFPIAVFIDKFVPDDLQLSAGFFYAAVNFLLLIFSCYAFRSYWNGKRHKIRGLFYLLLLIANAFIDILLAGAIIYAS